MFLKFYIIFSFNALNYSYSAIIQKRKVFITFCLVEILFLLLTMFMPKMNCNIPLESRIFFHHNLWEKGIEKPYTGTFVAMVTNILPLLL